MIYTVQKFSKIVFTHFFKTTLSFLKLRSHAVTVIKRHQASSSWAWNSCLTYCHKKNTKPALLALEPRVSRTVRKRHHVSSSWAWNSCLTYYQKKTPSQLFLGLKLMPHVLSEKDTKSALLGLETHVSHTVRKRHQASSSWAWNSCLTYYQKKTPSQLFLGLKLMSHVLSENGTKPQLFLGLKLMSRDNPSVIPLNSLLVHPDVLLTLRNSFSGPLRMLGLQQESGTTLHSNCLFGFSNEATFINKTKNNYVR